MSDALPLPVPAPPTRAFELERLDAALEGSARLVSLEDLKASGARAFRVFHRKDLLRQVLAVLEAFVEDRVRQAQAQLAALLERREREARAEGSQRVLVSLAEVGDLADAMLAAFPEGQAGLAARSLDQRIGHVFRTHGFERIATVGQPVDPALHEVVDEVAGSAEAPGRIVREVARGYRQGTFVLRPARVAVAAGA